MREDGNHRKERKDDGRREKREKRMEEWWESRKLEGKEG